MNTIYIIEGKQKVEKWNAGEKQSISSDDVNQFNFETEEEVMAFKQGVKFRRKPSEYIFISKADYLTLVNQ